MLRRAARMRVLVMLALCGLVGFLYQHGQLRRQSSMGAPPLGRTVATRDKPAITGGSSVGRFPDGEAVAAAQAAATNALVAAQSNQLGNLPLLKRAAPGSDTAAPVSATPDCAWPAGAQDLNRDSASSSCRPFVGLLVPCTSAKTCDHHGKCWKTIDDTSLLKELVPSVFSTLAGCACDCQRDECRQSVGGNFSPRRTSYDLVIYIGYDGGDAIYDTDAARSTLPHRLKAALQANTQGGTSGQHLPRIGLKLVRCPESRSMVSNSNCLSRTAHTDGAEYTYRVNDDTVFETPMWIETLPSALQSLTPPNLGVVGPRATGGNWKILTYDMVHRTHMDIFAGNRYPPSLQNWYSDDWITKVYSDDQSKKGGRQSAAQDCMRTKGPSCPDFKQGRMVMLAGTSVKHTRTVDHTRYTPDHSGKEKLPQLLKEGSESIASFLSGLEGAGAPIRSQSSLSTVSRGETQSDKPDVNAERAPAVTTTPMLQGGVKKEQQRSRSLPIAADKGGDKTERRHSQTSTQSSKTAAAIAAFGHCPDGRWELRGVQLVCPSAEAVPATTSEIGEANTEDNEDAAGARDERLSTRFDPNRMRSVCQLPSGRASGLKAEQHARLRSGWCETTAAYRRMLPTSGTSLLATEQQQDTAESIDGQGGQAAGGVIRASCTTGELRWTDRGHDIQRHTAAMAHTHGTTWRTIPRGKELKLPFSGSVEYVEVVCTLPQKTVRNSNELSPSVDAETGNEDYAWAAREVFTRFVPLPEYEAAPSLAASVGGNRLGTNGLNIVVLMIDSLSRAQAMSFLPNFRRLLEETAPPDSASAPAASVTDPPTHYSYVFDHAGTVGTHSGTNSNMGALFAGQKYNFVRDDAARVATLITPWVGTRMLWDELAEQGYVTAAVFPFGDLWGAAYWNSTFHHLAPSKYGARGGSYADHDQVLESSERGSKLSSDLDAGWIEGFLQAYSVRKKFLYAHFMEGHNAPEAAAQLDTNLVRLVRSAMAQPHTAVYVASDHGGVPRDLPLSSLFLPRDFLGQHADVSEALQANQHHYTTHYDMRMTLRHLSLWPKTPPHETSLPKEAASLLGPLGARRDCKADIGDGHCICRQWTTCVIGCTRSAEREAAEVTAGSTMGQAETEVLEQPDSKDGSVLAKVAVRRSRQAAERVLRDFNQQLLEKTGKYDSDATAAQSSCRYLTLGSLTHVRTQQLPEQGPTAGLVYVEFSVLESTYARFFASASFGPGQLAATPTTMSHDGPVGELVLENSGQLTMYQPFRECADARLPLPFCVCRDV